MRLDDAQSIKHNVLWVELCKEIDLIIDSTMKKLVVCNPQDVLRLQEEIKALNMLKTLPDAIVSREE